MPNKVAGSFLIAVLCSVCAAAQTSANTTNVRGQLLYPDGSPVSEILRFYLSRDDGLQNDYIYTDSKGVFILRGLDNRRSYTLTFTGDDASYGDTVYRLSSFYGRNTNVVVTLNPPRRIPRSPAATVSAASGYKPAPQVGSLYDKAMKEVAQQQYAAAETLLRQVIARDPKFAAPFNDLGALLMQLRRYEEAEKILRQGLQADPKFINALLNLGISLNHLRRYEEAVPPLRESLRLKPGMVSANEQLAISLVETDQFPEAEQLLQRCLKSPSADQALTQLYLGKLYARTGDFAKAVEAFQSYLEKAPNAANAGDVRALITQLQSRLSSRR